jgi:hypothetical protein
LAEYGPVGLQVTYTHRRVWKGPSGIPDGPRFDPVDSLRLFVCGPQTIPATPNGFDKLIWIRVSARQFLADFRNKYIDYFSLRLNFMRTIHAIQEHFLGSDLTGCRGK